MKKIATTLIGACLFLSASISVSADEKKANAPHQHDEVKANVRKPVPLEVPKKIDVKAEALSDKDMAATQRRLNALIKAATARQDSRNKKDPKKNTSAQSGDEHKHVTVKRSPTQGHGNCVAEEIFDFPQSVYVSEYSELTDIKNTIVTGPDSIDTHKVRLLALAYLGLGFGEEVQVLSEHLTGREQIVLDSMGRSVAGLVRKRDVRMIMRQAGCYEAAGLWGKFTKIQYDVRSKLAQDEAAKATKAREKEAEDKAQGHDAKRVSIKTSNKANDHEDAEHVPSEKAQGEEVISLAQVKQIKALPTALGVIMAKRIGLHAIEQGDMKTATRLMKFLKDRQRKEENVGPFDDEGKYFEAMYMIEHSDAMAMHILKALAKKDGVFQVRALNKLSTIDLKEGHANYPGFEEDLDGAAHVFAQHPEGKQALADKISFFVSTGNVNQAIGMTKEKFSPEDAHYLESVVLVSATMQGHFLGTDSEKKLNALNILLREQIFFDALVDGFPLRSAGISATLDLGLTELAPKVLPTEQWGRLDGHILRGLALQLPEELKTYLPKTAFVGAEFDVLEIKDAFQHKKPKQAMAILREIPENQKALEMAANQAWEAGYWGIARDTITDLSKAEKTKNKAMAAEKNLASVLSVPSPHLTPAQAGQNIDELNTLQDFLDADLKIIKEYVDGG